MRTNTLVAIMFALTVLLPWEGNVFAQQPQGKCSLISYAAPSTNLKSYRTNRVEGQAVYASTTAKWELGPVGLSPLAEYREMLKQIYHPQSKQQLDALPTKR
jgi:hypothetical protein